MAIVASMFDLVNAEGHFPRQRIQENFSSREIDLERWVETNTTGSAAFGMVSTVGEGYSILTSATNDDSNINFGDVRQYAPTSSIFKAVIKAVNTSTLVEVGFGESDTLPGGTDDYARIRINRNNATIQGLNRITGGSTIVDLGVLVHGNFTLGQGNLKSASVEYSLDEVLHGTATTNLPIDNMQPQFRCFTITSTNAEARITSFEAFNK